MNNMRLNMMNAGSGRPAISPPRARPVRKCGICRQPGHDRRSCPRQGASPPAPPVQPQGVRETQSSNVHPHPTTGGLRLRATQSSQQRSTDQRSNISRLDTTVDDRLKRDLQDALTNLLDKWKEYEALERDPSVHPQDTLQGKRVLHNAHLVTNACEHLNVQNAKRANVIRTLEVAMEDLTKQNFKDIAGMMVSDYNRQAEIYKSNQTVLKICKMTFKHTCRQWFTSIAEWEKGDRAATLKRAMLSIAEQPRHTDVCIEADDCPICLEPLGNTGKTILSCGHTLCTSCFIKQIVVANDQNKTDACACPVCRHKYTAGGSAPRTPHHSAAGGP